METDVRIKPFSLGAWMTNCYLIFNDKTKRCGVVDVGFEPEPMIRYMKDQGLVCEAIILTHSHLDHIAGCGEISSEWPEADILIHQAEADFLDDPVRNMSAGMGMSVISPRATATVADGQDITVAGMTMRVIHTPGHSPGGIVLYSREYSLAFVGDTIFQGSVGRYDFPTSDGEALFASIRDKVLILPDETRIFPGHGPDSTIGTERRANPFVIGLA